MTKKIGNRAKNDDVMKKSVITAQTFETYFSTNSVHIRKLMDHVNNFYSNP